MIKKIIDKLFPDTISAIRAFNVAVVILIILTLCLLCACEEGVKKEVKEPIVTAPVDPTQDPNYIPPNTYLADDYGLVPGRIVRWTPRSISDECNNEENFHKAEVFIHVKQSNGIVKAFPCTWKMWQTLTTDDTLK